MTATGFEPTTTCFVNEHLTIQPNWPNDGPVLWVLTCEVHLTVFYYHVTYLFQSESALCSCLNVKELFTQNTRLFWSIWSLSECNGIRTHNHLARKRTLKHLAKLTLKASLTKWLSVCLRTKWLWVRVLLLSLKNFRYGACFEQGVPWHSGKLQNVDSLWNSYETW